MSQPGQQSRPSLIDPTTLDSLLLVGYPGDGAGGYASDHAATDESNAHVIVTCPACDALLGLPAPRVAQRSTMWRCEDCHVVTASAPHRIASNEPSRARVVKEERLHPYDFDRRFDEVDDTLFGATLAYIERRDAPRRILSVPLVGTPLDDKLLVSGISIQVTCRDISRSGLSFVSRSRVYAPCMLIDFTPTYASGRQVLVEVVREREVRKGFEYGCRFITTE